MKTERELLAQREALMTQARDLNAKAETESRDFTPEEQTTWDKNQADIATLDKQIERVRYLAVVPPQRPIGAPALLHGKRGDSFNAEFCNYLRTGDKSQELRSRMVKEKQGDAVEFRASNATDMNITTAADGGYVDPTGLYNQIVAKRTEMSLPSKLGVQMIPGKGTTVDVPYDNEGDGEFISTNESGQFDKDAPAIGQAAMTLVKYSKYLMITQELLEDEDSNLMAFLNDWIARGQAKTYNQLLLAQVVAAGTSYKTTASATAIVAGELEAVLYNDTIGGYLDDAGSLAWVMKPSTYGAIKSILGDARLYGDEAVANGRQIMGYPAYFSVKAGAITANLQPVFFGNWHFVGQREAPAFTMLRDPYSAANLGQVKLWMYFRTVFKVLQPDAVGYLHTHT
jgi:HK97 family phage major capsid protein